MDKPPRLVFRRTQDAPHILVFAHGITQTARGLYGFADLVAAHAPEVDIAIFDYDWKQPLATSGAQLAAQLADLRRHRHITLVGYSMGGLIARLAVADHAPAKVRTVLTLATPNRGALTPAQLGPLAQDTVEGGKRLVSPIAHCPGVRQLAEVDPIMRERSLRADVQAAVQDKRYGSVPALYFHPNRYWREAKTPMRKAGLAMGAIKKMPRPHDGIVAEPSNDLVARARGDFAEFHHARYDGASPARCHAIHAEALDLDHISILQSEAIAEVVADLARAPDWAAFGLGPSLQVFVG